MAFISKTDMFEMDLRTGRVKTFSSLDKTEGADELLRGFSEPFPPTGVRPDALMCCMAGEIRRQKQMLYYGLNFNLNFKGQIRP